LLKDKKKNPAQNQHHQHHHHHHNENENENEDYWERFKRHYGHFDCEIFLKNLLLQNC